jgi:hypothetical protein
MIPTCDLCGLASLDVRPGLARYPEGWRSVLRCANHAACRERVYLAGEKWPLMERVTP